MPGRYQPLAKPEDDSGVDVIDQPEHRVAVALLAVLFGLRRMLVDGYQSFRSILNAGIEADSGRTDVIADAAILALAPYIDRHQRHQICCGEFIIFDKKGLIIASEQQELLSITPKPG